MGVVTLHAIPIHHNFMTAFGILRHDLLMTLIADLVRIFVQQLSMRGCVRIVALRAIS
jgi:hypothetical protein